MDDLSKLFQGVKEEAFKSFLLEYTRNGFGSLSKHDVDLLVWDIITKISDSFQNKSTYELANLMKIPESKIKSIQIESHLKYGNGNRNDFKKEIIEKIKNGKINPEIEGDKIRFLLEDQVLKREIENAIKSSGHLIDYSFNKDIVNIRLSIFMQAFSHDNTLEQKIVNTMKEQFKNDAKMKKEFATVFTVKDILKAGGNLFAGKATGKVLEIIIDKIWEHYDR